MKFLVVSKMHGYGCDYTIGCGMRFDWVEAESAEEAERKIVEDYGVKPSESDEQPLKEIYVIPEKYVHKLDVEYHVQAKTLRINREKEEREKQKDMKELDRLQKKYRQANWKI